MCLVLFLYLVVGARMAMVMTVATAEMMEMMEMMEVMEMMEMMIAELVMGGTREVRECT